MHLIEMNTNFDKPRIDTSIYYEVFRRMFSNRIHRMSEINSACIDKLLYGDGPGVGHLYSTEAFDKYAHHLNKFPQYIYDLFNVPSFDRFDRSKNNKPLVLLMARTSGEIYRRLSPNSFERLAAQLEIKGFQPQICCDFSSITLEWLLKEKLSHAIAIIAPHGAGLMNSIYLAADRRITVAEIVGAHGSDSCCFHVIGRYFNQTHIFVVARPPPWRPGVASDDNMMKLSGEQINSLVDFVYDNYLYGVGFNHKNIAYINNREPSMCVPIFDDGYNQTQAGVPNLIW